jgi:hypothetical protein
MLAAMVATAILVTPIGIALIPAPTDSYPQSSGFPRVEQPVEPQELEQNVKRQASARRAAELTKLLRLAESPATMAESSSAASDAFDGRTSPQMKTPETQRRDAVDGAASVSMPLPSQQWPADTDVQRSVSSPEAMNAKGQTETGAAVAEVEPAIESTTVSPRAKSLRARLHARRRTRLIRGTTASAPPAATQSNADANTYSFTGAHRTVNTSPVAPAASGGERGTAF